MEIVQRNKMQYFQLKRNEIRPIDVLSAIVMLYYLNPLAMFYRSNMQMFVSIFCWTIFAAFSDYPSFSKALTQKSVFYGAFVPITLVFMNLIHGTEIEGKIILIAFTYIIAIFILQSSTRRQIRFILTCLYCQHFIVLVNTISLLRKEPMLARLLAQGYTEETLSYQGVFVGGYGFTYSTLFVALLFTYAILFYKKKFLYVLLLFVECYFLLKAQYAISILLYIVGTAIMFFLKILESKYKSIAIVFFPVLTLFGVILLIYLLLPLLTKTKLGFISSHINDLVELFAGRLLLEDQKFQRLPLYAKSLESFINNPILGVGYIEEEIGKYEIIGRHSTFFDYLAKWGIFPNFFMYLSMACFFNQVFNYLKQEKNIFVFVVIYLLLSIVNLSHTPEVMFTINVVVPLSLTLFKQDNGLTSSAKRLMVN